MNYLHKFNQNSLIAVLLALILITLLVQANPTPVRAAEPQAGNSEAVPGGPGYIMVPATAFIPELSDAKYLVFWGELSVPEGSPNSYYSFNAPVYLPQGARLTKLTLYYRDTTDDTNSLGVTLLRKPLPSLSSGESTGLEVYSSLIGFSAYESDTTPGPTQQVVDNSEFIYWLNLYIYAAPAYLQLQGVRIDYEYGVSMPVISR